MTKHTTLVLDVELYQKVKRAAFDADETISATIDRILRKEFPDAPAVKQEGPVKPADIDIDWGKQ